jgi:hypothetical protein
LRRNAYMQLLLTAHAGVRITMDVENGGTGQNGCTTIMEVGITMDVKTGGTNHNRGTKNVEVRISVGERSGEIRITMEVQNT